MTFLYLISIIWLWWFVFHNARIKDLQKRVKELENIEQKVMKLEKKINNQEDQLISLSGYYAKLDKRSELLKESIRGAISHEYKGEEDE